MRADNPERRENCRQRNAVALSHRSSQKNYHSSKDTSLQEDFSSNKVDDISQSWAKEIYVTLWN